jgi:hypothetical protein
MGANRVYGCERNGCEGASRGIVVVGEVGGRDTVTAANLTLVKFAARVIAMSGVQTVLRSRKTSVTVLHGC